MLLMLVLSLHMLSPTLLLLHRNLHMYRILHMFNLWSNRNQQMRCRHRWLQRSMASVDAIAFGAAISACEMGAGLEQALALLRKMHETGMTAGVISLSAAISACEKRGHWEQALALRHKMRVSGLRTSQRARREGSESRLCRCLTGCATPARLPM